jgi:hypothetical protein
MAKATQYGVLVLTCGTLLSSQGTNAQEYFPILLGLFQGEIPNLVICRYQVKSDTNDQLGLLRSCLMKPRPLLGFLQIRVSSQSYRRDVWCSGSARKPLLSKGNTAKCALAAAKY